VTVSGIQIELYNIDNGKSIPLELAVHNNDKIDVKLMVFLIIGYVDG
jgi:hypothetical protein